jgi:hypothetical protein
MTRIKRKLIAVDVVPSDIADYVRRRLGIKFLNDDSDNSFKVSSEKELHSVHNLLSNRDIKRYVETCSILSNTINNTDYLFFITRLVDDTVFVRYYPKDNVDKKS